MSALCGANSCQGGPPRPQTEDRLTVCGRCRVVTEQRLSGLERLYEDLLRPTRATGPTRRSEGSERPSALSGGAIEARAGIRRELNRWSAQNAHVIRATPQVHDVGAQARHVRGLMVRYLSTDLGPLLVDAIDDVWGAAWRAAFPEKPAGHVIGACPCAGLEDPEAACGGKVRAMVDRVAAEGFAVCQKCDATAPLEWWRANMPAGHDDWMLITDLRWHLVVMVGVRVPANTVHSWVHRGHLPTDIDRYGRTTYQVSSAIALAQRAADRLIKVGSRAE